MLRRRILRTDNKIDEGNSKSTFFVEDEIESGGIDHNQKQNKNNTPTVSEVVDKRLVNPAWTDEDDTGELFVIPTQRKYKKLRLQSEEEKLLSFNDLEDQLRKNFSTVIGNPHWASIPKTFDGTSYRESLQNCYQKNSRKIFNIFPIGFTSHDVENSLRFIDFHPTKPVLLSAGVSKTINVFQINKNAIAKLQNIYFENYPLQMALFSADGQQIILSSRNRPLWFYDLQSNRTLKMEESAKYMTSCKSFSTSPDNKLIAVTCDDGYIRLISYHTKELIDNLKVNGSVHVTNFSNDGSKLFAGGGDGEIYVWDVGRRACIHKFLDEGCISCSTICTSRDGKYFVSGSTAGSVNIYYQDHIWKCRPEPIKKFQNLHSTIKASAINLRSEMLAYSSCKHKNALKLVDLNSLCIIPHWPSHQTRLGFVESVSFSADGNQLAIGNSSGKISVYEISNNRHW